MSPREVTGSATYRDAVEALGALDVLVSRLGVMGGEFYSPLQRLWDVVRDYEAEATRLAELLDDREN